MAVKLDVGGTIFRVKSSIFKNIPGSKLSQLSPDSIEYDPDSKTYYFDINPSFFNNILDCYRTGKLHIPQTMCIAAAESELKFWNIPECYISPCCMSNYYDFKIKEKTCREFYFECFTRFDILNESIEKSTGLQKNLLVIWKYLEFTHFSKLAKVGKLYE